MIEIQVYGSNVGGGKEYEIAPEVLRVYIIYKDRQHTFSPVATEIGIYQLTLTSFPIISDSIVELQLT